jgi:transposase-like protein
MRGRKHPDDLRAQVMASLLAGQGVSEVAAQYELDISVVSRWKSAIPSEQLQVVASKKSEEIEGLLFKYLTQTLKTLTIQSEVASEREYILKQPAGEFAVLHGVMADKSIRLLEAIHRANESARTQSESAAA